MIEYRGYDEDLLSPLSEMSISEGWDSFRDPETARNAFTSPGCIIVAAFDGETPVGFIQLQTDRGIHAHISNILVLSSYRGNGIGRRLVELAFDQSGAKYIDLVSTEGSDEFYRSFEHEEFPGFRIYPRGRG